jgi:succinate dehydrogenase flavin-adding protein (antitoxin of CptAB toxin-antitoxin module)
MRELDIMLTRFLDTRYDGLDDRKKLAFQQLLTVQDPVLFKMMIGRLEAQEQRFNEIVQEILATDPHAPATP